jgi:hypothetical protein
MLFTLSPLMTGFLIKITQDGSKKNHRIRIKANLLSFYYVKKNEHFAGFIDIFLISDSGYLNHGTAGSANYYKFVRFAQKYHIFMGKAWANIDNQAMATDYRRKHGIILRIKKSRICRN